MDAGRINQVLGPLMLLIWALLWFIYWLSGRSLELGILLIAIGITVSIVIITVRNYLWKNYPAELLGLKKSEGRKPDDEP